MTTPTVTQPVNFTRQDVNAAINEALGKVTDERWVRAIYRAAAHLAAGQFAYDGRVVTLRSASSKRVYYITVAEPMTCTCEGRARGYICWHISAARLLVRAAERHQEQLRRAACPMCGAPLEPRQYYVGGKGYTFFDVCSGDATHHGRAA